MKGRNLEKVVNSQDSTINLLETSIISTHQYYCDQMADLQKSLENQTKATAHMESLANSFREERDYYQKQYRKQRRKKNVLTYLGVGLVVLIVAK